MASNPEEDANISKPSAETTGETEAPAAQDAEQKTTSEPDYKVKFTESSKEALRLREELEKAKKDIVQTQDVMEVLYENPNLLAEVQKAYTQKTNPIAEPVDTPLETIPDKVLDAKLQKVVSPIRAELDSERKLRVEEAVRDFSERHPDAAEGTETWKQMLEWLPAMHQKGLPLKAGLEKAHEIVTIDKAKQSGKLEALKGIFERTQAAAAGGSSGGAARNQSEAVELTPAELKVAERLGVKPESYQKRKISP